MEDDSISIYMVCNQTKLVVCQKRAACAHRAELVMKQLRLSNGNHVRNFITSELVTRQIADNALMLVVCHL